MKAPHQRDILGEIFQDRTANTAVPGLEELEALLSSCLAPPSSRPVEPKLLPLPTRKTVSRRKTTHYLQKDVFDGLTQAKQILKRLLPDGAKSRASKSNLVNHAVNIMLREIEEKGSDSPLVQAILNIKDDHGGCP